MVCTHAFYHASHTGFLVRVGICQLEHSLLLRCSLRKASRALCQIRGQTPPYPVLKAEAGRKVSATAAVEEGIKARERANSRVRAAVAALRIAEDEVEGLTVSAHEAGFRFGSDLGVTGGAEGSVHDRMRIVGGSRAACVEVRNWRLLPSPWILAAVQLCESVSAELNNIGELKLDPEHRRATIETAALSLARCSSARPAARTPSGRSALPPKLTSRSAPRSDLPSAPTA